VHFSGKNITAQVIDDETGKTLASANTTEKALRAAIPRANVETAVKIGKAVAERAKANNVTKVVFDRGGFFYHGKVKALADAAREGGLEF
jgi:large subunit ribosomal protein L18